MLLLVSVSFAGPTKGPPDLPPAAAAAVPVVVVPGVTEAALSAAKAPIPCVTFGYTEVEWTLMCKSPGPNLSCTASAAGGKTGSVSTADGKLVVDIDGNEVQLDLPEASSQLLFGTVGVGKEK